MPDTAAGTHAFTQSFTCTQLSTLARVYSLSHSFACTHAHIYLFGHLHWNCPIGHRNYTSLIHTIFRWFISSSLSRCFQTSSFRQLFTSSYYLLAFPVVYSLEDSILGHSLCFPSRGCLLFKSITFFRSLVWCCVGLTSSIALCLWYCLELECNNLSKVTLTEHMLITISRVMLFTSGREHQCFGVRLISGPKIKVHPDNIMHL